MYSLYSRRVSRCNQCMALIVRKKTKARFVGIALIVNGLDIYVLRFVYYTHSIYPDCDRYVMDGKKDDEKCLAAKNDILS